MKYNFDEPVDRSKNRSAKYDERVKNFGTDSALDCRYGFQDSAAYY